VEIPNQYLELVRDALYARNMKYVGSFAFNKSSERVLQIGLPVMPALEYVIHNEAMPRCPMDPTAQFEAFPGISSLVLDYFRIVKTAGQLDRAAQFISSLSGAVLVEAIRYIGIEWDHVIPEAFMNTIDRAAQSGLPEVRDAATWALKWHNSKP
jgi:hypothetical protein